MGHSYFSGGKKFNAKYMLRQRRISSLSPVWVVDQDPISNKQINKQISARTVT